MIKLKIASVENISNWRKNLF